MAWARCASAEPPDEGSIPTSSTSTTTRPGGPLKGREIAESRAAPLRSCDARRIRKLIKDGGITGPLFADWDWEKFGRDVWAPAKSAMILRHRGLTASRQGDRRATDALCSALERLRLHHLCHAACSMWLNTPGIEARGACEWSGHKRLNVSPEIYQGLMPGSETSAKQRLDAAWGR